MKTLADEIITGKYKNIGNNSTKDYAMQKKKTKIMNKTKPKSAGNKSFRIHNNIKFLNTKERKRLGTENKL
jgi:hypothetical protein